MIERADIFQLFWSRNAAKSKYVENEWRYALRLGREPSRFIRPVYWTEPMLPPPPELRRLTSPLSPNWPRCSGGSYPVPIDSSPAWRRGPPRCRAADLPAPRGGRMSFHEGGLI